MSPKTRTDRPEEFVKHYLTGITATEAAKRAGYSEKSAAAQGYRLLKNNEYVRRRIAEVQAEQQEKTGWTMDRAMSDLDGVIKLATDAKQFNAVVRATEVKAKMAGHLKDATVNVGFQIDMNAALADARARVENLRRESVAIDVTSRPLLKKEGS